MSSFRGKVTNFSYLYSKYTSDALQNHLKKVVLIGTTIYVLSKSKTYKLYLFLDKELFPCFSLHGLITLMISDSSVDMLLSTVRFTWCLCIIMAVFHHWIYCQLQMYTSSQEQNSCVVISASSL